MLIHRAITLLFQDEWHESRQKVMLQQKKSPRIFEARGQLILINLVPSGDFSSLSRFKCATVGKERARVQWLPNFHFPLQLSGFPKRSHKGEHRSYKTNERSGGLQSGAKRWAGKIKLERPASREAEAGRQAGRRPRRAGNEKVEQYSVRQFR